MNDERTSDELRYFVFGVVDVCCGGGIIVDRVETNTTLTLTVDQITPLQLIHISSGCQSAFRLEGYEGIQINFSVGSGTTYIVEAIIPDQLLA